MVLQKAVVLASAIPQDRGVDFPARPPQEDHGVPYYTPPAGPPPGMGPEEGLSAEDAAAINAALAQNELEERQRQEQEAALAPPGNWVVHRAGIVGMELLGGSMLVWRHPGGLGLHCQAERL